LPVVGVDWFDAVGFCAFYNKHLCGKIGGGGPVDSTSSAVYDKAQGEWFNACSRGGARAFPYGATYDSQACNGADFGSPHANQPNAAGQTPTCAGGFDGLFDMSGNVQEWLDSCETPSPHLAQCTDAGPQCDLCRSGGGGFASPESRLGCGGGDLLLRDEHFADTGFRCCADLR
jgi:formylglycine-generating enzyme required for sulfatase activity